MLIRTFFSVDSLSTVDNMTGPSVSVIKRPLSTCVTKQWGLMYVHTKNLTYCPTLTFSQVTLGLSRHLAHYLRAVDEEEESTRFIGYCSGNEGLPSTRRSIQEDASGRL